MHDDDDDRLATIDWPTADRTDVLAADQGGQWDAAEGGFRGDESAAASWWRSTRTPEWRVSPAGQTFGKDEDSSDLAATLLGMIPTHQNGHERTSTSCREWQSGRVAASHRRRVAAAASRTPPGRSNHHGTRHAFLPHRFQMSDGQIMSSQHLRSHIQGNCGKGVGIRSSSASAFQRFSSLEPPQPQKEGAGSICSHASLLQSALLEPCQHKTWKSGITRFLPPLILIVSAPCAFHRVWLWVLPPGRWSVGYQTSHPASWTTGGCNPHQSRCKPVDRICRTAIRSSLLHLVFHRVRSHLIRETGERTTFDPRMGPKSSASSGRRAAGFLAQVETERGIEWRNETESLVIRTRSTHNRYTSDSAPDAVASPSILSEAQSFSHLIGSADLSKKLKILL